MKNKQVGLHQTKNLLHSKASCQQSKKTAYWMKEDICKWYIWLGVNMQSLRKKKKKKHATEQQKKKKKKEKINLI